MMGMSPRAVRETDRLLRLLEELGEGRDTESRRTTGSLARSAGLSRDRARRLLRRAEEDGRVAGGLGFVDGARTVHVIWRYRPRGSGR